MFLLDVTCQILKVSIVLIVMIHFQPVGDLGKTDNQIDLGTYEGKYPNSLFNKGVRTENEDHVGHVMKETDDKIVVFGYGNERFDIPESEIIAVGRNVIVKQNFPELFTYKVDMNAPLPTGEPIEKIDEEAYPDMSWS